MKRRSIVSRIAIFCFLCAGLLLGCQTGAPGGASRQFARNNLASFYSRTLDNGIPVVIKKNETNRVFSLLIGLKGQAMVTPPAQAGIEAVTLRTLAKGSARYPYERIEQELFEKSSLITAATNSFDVTSFNLVTLDKYFDELFPIYLDCFLHPAWEKTEFERTVNDMKIARQENMNDPLGLAAEKLHERFFQGHPYRASFTGTEESLSRLTLEDARKYYADYFVPERMFIVAVGNFNPDDLYLKLNTALGKLPKKGLAVPPVPAFAPLTDSTLLLQPFPASAGVAYLRADTPVPSVDHPDYPALLIASAMYDDLLYQVIRIEHGAAYGMWANPFSFKQNYLSLVVFKTTVPEKVKQYVDDAASVLLKGKCLGVRVSSAPEGNKAAPPQAADYVPIAEAIEFYKAQYLNQYFLKQETNASIAAQILSSLVYRNDYRDYLYFMERINAVTADDIQRVSRKYFYEQPKAWIVVSSQDLLDKIDRSSFLRFLGDKP